MSLRWPQVKLIWLLSLQPFPEIPSELSDSLDGVYKMKVSMWRSQFFPGGLMEMKVLFLERITGSSLGPPGRLRNPKATTMSGWFQGFPCLSSTAEEIFTAPCVWSLGTVSIVTPTTEHFFLSGPQMCTERKHSLLRLRSQETILEVRLIQFCSPHTHELACLLEI